MAFVDFLFAAQTLTCTVPIEVAITRVQDGKLCACYHSFIRPELQADQMAKVSLKYPQLQTNEQIRDFVECTDAISLMQFGKEMCTFITESSETL